MKDNDTLSNEIDVIFDNIQDFNREASYTAKDIIMSADKFVKTPAEYIKAVQSWIDIFEEAHKISIERGQKE